VYGLPRGNPSPGLALRVGSDRHHPQRMTEPASSGEASLAERLLAGDRRALARAITLVENDDPAGWEVVRAVYPRTGKAAIVGFTGPPGAGKSTLLAELTKLERDAGRSVAVLSIDPSSPFSKGALLGDRIRLSDHFLDPGVFIRSMANRGALGGLSEAALQTTLLMDASGRDLVLLETVGVGQAEVDVVDLADTVVLVLMPGSGDSVQALKAGVMEIPDVIVVNKADHPLADATVREVQGMLALAPHGARRVPVIRTTATSGEGVEELMTRIAEHRAHIEAEGTLAGRRRRNLRSEVVALATQRLRRELEASIADDPAFDELLDRVVERELDPASAAAGILEVLNSRRQDAGSNRSG
jgi:LAO/AO transport system kinase